MSNSRGRGRPKGVSGKAGKKIGITIPHDLDKDFDELAELSGTKKATLITDFLVNIQPHLQTTIKYTKAIKAHEMNLEDARKYFFGMLADYNDMVSDAIREISNDD